MSLKIYHNSQCSKSNAAWSALENHHIDFITINYLENPPSVEELKELIQQLGITPLELVRVNETIFNEKYRGKNLTDEELIVAMHENPILIQRPIIVKDDKAVIARSEEAIRSIL
ncbi:arsenate reductase family protein [Pedobacter sp. ASV28]|uniref:arsenate reductase family protein n=1 Tax=Pedobacter sp. ASV28 TaxID=2795123 RepID=UPI0018ED13E4|nr:arsenate reductase family protein [Pedobacter sp. ASV28]